MIGDYKMIRSTIGRPQRLFREFYAANVVKSVHVEAAYGGQDAVEETAWLDMVAREFGFPNALVVCSDLRAPSVEAELLRHLEASPLTRGVRPRPAPDDTADKRFLAGVRSLRKLGLSYELNASPGGLSSGRELAAAFPDTPIIVGHAGLPLQRDPAYFAHWKDEMATLAALPNLACKISGLGMIDHDWTIESTRPWILHCIDIFGPERIMFGTNWPVDILFATYLEQTDAYRTILAAAGFSQSEQEAMLGRNAERFYGI